MRMMARLMIVFAAMVEPAVAAPAAPAEAAAPNSGVLAADDAFEALARQFANLRRSLQAARAITEKDLPVIREFRDRVRQFSGRNPEHLRAITMDLALSQWLADEEAIQSLFARLTELRPDDDDIRLLWARHELSLNRYESVERILGQRLPDPEKSPAAVKALGDARIAAGRFAEALELYRSIPQAALQRDPLLQGEVTSVLSNLSEYPSKWEQEQQVRAQEAGDPNPLPRVELWTNRGRIVLELYENQAPNTVANFITLVEDGFYNRTKFHRVIGNFMAQVGDPRSRVEESERGQEDGPGYTIVDECTREDRRLHFPGTLSMANKGPNTGGSQFFITVTATPWLDGKHTAFGRVIEGLDVARRIKQDDVLEIARVLRKRDHEYTVSTFTAPPPAPAQPTPLTITPGTPSSGGKNAP
jgi:cyclophilin family peptidyl-prolyl cis-trans isomerase